jgi:hypothetical protein
MDLGKAMMQPGRFYLRSNFLFLMFPMPFDEVIHFWFHLLGRAVFMNRPVRPGGVIRVNLPRPLQQRSLDIMAQMVPGFGEILFPGQFGV